MGSGELAGRRENPDPRSHGTAQTYGGRDVSAGRAYNERTQSAAAFCAEHGVLYRQFNYWRRKCRQKTEA